MYLPLLAGSRSHDPCLTSSKFACLSRQSRPDLRTATDANLAPPLLVAALAVLGGLVAAVAARVALDSLAFAATSESHVLVRLRAAVEVASALQRRERRRHWSGVHHCRAPSRRPSYGRPAPWLA